MVAITSRLALGVTNCRPAADVLSSIQDAEAVGAEAVFVAEDINCRDAFQLCALAAARTDRIRLATGVVNPYTRNPTSLAMAIATLDEVSRGRAILGMGTSSPSLVQEQMGIAHGKPVAVMREATQIIRALLAGGAVTYAGSHFVYQAAHLEVAVSRRIPIFFAAMGPLMLRLVGQIADGVLLNVGASVEYVRWAVAEIHAGAQAAGRVPSDLTIAAWHSVYVTDDEESGLERARRWLAGVLSIPRQGEILLQHAGGDPAILPKIRELVSAYPHTGDRAAAGELIPDELARRMTLIGDPTVIRRRLEEYREAGVDLPVIGIGAVRALYGAR
jgi:5,10-methylenetetrahydromethanopterin reductase